MPLQKRRHSNQRTRKRRTHYKLTPPVLATCRCGQKRLDYHACPSCGYYGHGVASRKVIDIKIKQPETEEA